MNIPRVYYVFIYTGTVGINTQCIYNIGVPSEINFKLTY